MRFLTGVACGICSIFLLRCPLVGQERAATQPVDIIFYDAKVLTLDQNFSIAQAVAVSGQQVRAVGRNADVLREAGPNTLMIDLKGRTVIPGLIDTHSHIDAYAEQAYGAELGPEKLHRYPVDWRGVRTKDDVLNQIKGLMDKYQFRPGEWIYFDNQLQFISGGSVEQARILYDELNRWELDKVSPNNPVVLSLGIPDGAGFLVNSKAIEILWEKYGDFKTYGRYWVDSSGRPEGHLEPPVSRHVLEILPGPAPEDVAPVYQKYLEELAASGVTTVSTRLDGYGVKAYQLLESQRQMTLRMAYGIETYFGSAPALENGLKNLQNVVGTGSEKVWVNSIAPRGVDGASTRACTDQRRTGGAFGVIDSWWPTGQCHTDVEYRGAKGKAASIQRNYFQDWLLHSARNGTRFANTHVAGDRSVKNLLNMIEQIQQQRGPSATQAWSFDHCTFVNPADLPRAAKLGVIFSCAPKYIEGVGPTAAKSYGGKMAHTFVVPVKSMLNAGVKVVFESDRDTYAWHDLELLLTRKDRRGNVWGPQERVDRSTVLKMATRWAADYVLKGNQLGSIEPGKLADLVVLDRDYMTIPDEEVSEIRPQVTIFDGKIVFVHRQFAEEYNLRPTGAIVSTYEELKARRPQGNSGRGEAL